MNLVSNQSLESILDMREDGNAKHSISEEYHGISASPQPFDALSYFDHCPFDDVFFQGLGGYESYLSGLGYDSISTAMSSPSTYPTSSASMPPGTSQEFPIRTRNDPGVPQPINVTLNPSIRNQLNESLPSPNQISPNIGFGLSNEADLNATAQIQSVRNSQLEKRRAQNRNSQRAFRERKESYTNHLERELLCLREKYDTALRCLYRLKAAYAAIESLDRFDVAISERGMGPAVEQLKKEVESETYGAR